MEILYIVGLAVARSAHFKFKDTRDIFAKKCYNDKVLVVEGGDDGHVCERILKSVDRIILSIVDILKKKYEAWEQLG